MNRFFIFANVDLISSWVVCDFLYNKITKITYDGIKLEIIRSASSGVGGENVSLGATTNCEGRAGETSSVG